jgi:hypothetical protein
MRRIHLSVAFLLLPGCVCSQAQIISPGPYPQPPFQQVKAYLVLTDAQVSQIVLNLSDYGRLVSQRQQRMFQVQSEIQMETAKSPLDPAALGIRYAEIETICRNVRDEGIAAQNRNLGVLTDAQKAKLKALEDAYKLLPIINEAQNAGLLTPPGPYAAFGPQLFFNPTGFVSPVLLSGCQQPTLVIRTGDFSGTLP